MKKLLLLISGLLILQNIGMANDTVKFAFPNEGWHAVASPDGIAAKKSFVPAGQTSTNYTEMVTLTEKVSKHHNMPPITFLQKQIGKDKTNYPDIEPQYVTSSYDNAIVTWCSQLKNTCAVERAFNGKDGTIIAIYTNKAPHYSQNMFGQWINNLHQMKVYDPETMLNKNNLIEL